MRVSIETYRTWGNIREDVFSGYGIFLNDDFIPIYRGTLEECKKQINNYDYSFLFSEREC